MIQVFNSIEPFARYSLQVDDLHTLYIEECGSPEGVPVIFLHGGPGGGCSPYHRRFFDPSIYRIILFDQRGCGKSTPHASLEQNTSWDLVQDIERIRYRLSIQKWVVFGGSWGSTLALLYAQTHPEQVSGLILRGIFLARDKDVQWFYQQGTNKLFPDYWQKFIEPVPVAERGDMVAAYSRLLNGDDEAVQLKAAKAWSVWEGMTATLQTDAGVVSSFSDSHTALSIARIECHYFMNSCWLEPNQIIANIERIRHIPGYIVQGRYDVICPVEQAWELAAAWPEANLTIVGDAGHAIIEKGVTGALLRASREISEKLV